MVSGNRQIFFEFAQMTLDGRAEAKRNGDYATEQLYKYYGNGFMGNSRKGTAVRKNTYYMINMTVPKMI